MPDQATPGLSRIALVFGDEAAAAHVREAMAGRVDIVYAASAGEFDASRLTAAHALAALVNLDDGDWLDQIETTLNAAGVPAVFNDPEISLKLEGWERARWLRHLVAKLRGSSDVDPPRPEAPSPSVPAREIEAIAPADDFSAPPVGIPVIERPLSPEEIETMTVDFVAEQKSVPVQAVEAVPTAVVEATADAGILSLDVSEQAVAMVEPSVRFEPDLEPAAETALAAGARLEAPAAQAEVQPAAPDFDTETALDVDTEALSAMIDARLAEPDAAEPSGSPEVWREVSGSAVSPVQPDDGVAGEEESRPDVAPAVVPVAATHDDADVLAGLPSLDDWQLVDHDVAPTPAAGDGARKAPEPALSDAFAGLELVPMETVLPLRVDADPIERWFGGDLGKKAVANDAAGSDVKEASHEHG